MSWMLHSLAFPNLKTRNTPEVLRGGGMHDTIIVSKIVLGVVMLSGMFLSAQDKPSEEPSNSAANLSQKPFVVEYYYKVKWGHADEFFTLFKKNHLPLLLKEVGMGRLLQVTATKPRYHNTEDGRWDYRVTIVFKNANAANDDFDEAALAKQLFPDQETYKREEQRRFEILEAHWDLPIKAIDLNAK
jgi:hypothetical protein